MKIFINRKDGKANSEVEFPNSVVIREPSVVKLKLSPEQIVRYTRRGADLLLILDDGKEVLIEGFFTRYDKNGQPIQQADDGSASESQADIDPNDPMLRSDLLLEDAQGVLWWGQYPDTWSEFHFTEIEWDDAGAVLWPWLLGALGGVGGAAYALAGSKNKPPVAVDDSVTADEDSGPHRGSVISNDRDPDGDRLTVLTFTVEGRTYQAGETAEIDSVGTVTINANGEYVFTPVPNYHGTLPPIGYVISDGDLQSSATLTIVITPVVDLVAGDDTNETAEDTPVDGVLYDNDSTTSGGELSFSKESDPSNGSVVVRPDGSYTYTPNENFYGEDSFTYTVVDAASGEELTKTVTITVTSVNDLPEISEDDSSAGVVEAALQSDRTTVAGTPTASGTFTATDVEDEDSELIWSVVDPDTVYGTFEITDPATGAWVYTLNNDSDAVQKLNEGDEVPLTFTVQVTDSDGGVDTRTVTITITGRNDAPTAVADTNSVTEAGVAAVEGVDDSGNSEFADTRSASGNVLANDTDVDDILTNGEGEDDDTADLSVSGIRTGGLTDTDGTTIGTVGGSLNGTYGTLVMGADGEYVYTLRNDIEATQQLKAGQETQDFFTYTVVDPHGASHVATLTITVTGTNDQPQISLPEDGDAGDGIVTSQISGSVKEQGVDNEDVDPVVGGKLIAGDVDTGAVLTWGPDETEGTYGTLEVDPETGVWTYTLVNDRPATQALVDGDVKSDSFTVRVTDEFGAYQTQVVTITVNGTNDAPVITSSDADLTGSVIEAALQSDRSVLAGTATDSGQLRATDGDTGAVLTWSVAQPDGVYGSISIDPATNIWTYTLDNSRAATQALTGDDVKTETFTVRVTDNQGNVTEKDIVVTVNGRNDAPTAANDFDSVTEQGVAAVAGEVDSGNTQVVGDAVAEGNVLTNDSDVDTGDKADLRVDAIRTGAIDADTGTTAGTVGVGVLTGTYGTLEIDEFGEYTYTLKNDFPATNALAQGAPAADVFTYTVTDPSGATHQAMLTINVTGTNDMPVIILAEDGALGDGVTTSQVSGAVTEGVTGGAGGSPEASGTLVATDVDAGAQETWTIAQPQGTYGRISVDSDGKWTYTVDNTLPTTQGLNSGEKGTETFDVRVTDEHGAFVTQQVTITVTGANDAPVGQGKVIIPLNEDAALAGSPYVGNISTSLTDVDDVLTVTGFKVDVNGDGVAEAFLAGQTATLQDAAGNPIGTFTMTSGGAYEFTAAPNYAGDVPSIEYSVVGGTSGNPASQTLEFVLTPVADAPTLPANTIVGTVEDTAVALELVAPVINDAGTSASTDDYPERIGAITLTIGGNGADGVTLLNGVEVLTPVDGKLTIVLTDVPHITDVPAADADAGVYHMTAEQYADLVAVPNSESGDNFTVTVDVTSYEVDASGAVRTQTVGDVTTPLPGAPAVPQIITVDVQAVTDKAILTLSATEVQRTFAEDTTFNLTPYLSRTLGDSDGRTGPDADGSETYSYEVSGLPVGSMVNFGAGDVRVATVGQVITYDAGNNSTLPAISFKPPANFSGDLPTVTLTLVTRDTDIDYDGEIEPGRSSVELQLYVNPVAGDVTWPAQVVTPEDTAVNFLSHVTFGDADNSELLTSLSFKILSDWTLTVPVNAAPYYTVVGGEGKITFPSGMSVAEQKAVLDGFVYRPPAQSSADAEITIKAVTLDSAVVNGELVTSENEKTGPLNITVTPVAERTKTDSDEPADATNGVTMNGDHLYTVEGEEDRWFALGTNYQDASNSTGGIALGAPWSNEDTDEFLFAVLTPVLSEAGEGDIVEGTTFRYFPTSGDPVELIYDGEPLWVPAKYMDSLQVRLPENVSGTLTIKVNAGTLDFDDDNEVDPDDWDAVYASPSDYISGEADSPYGLPVVSVSGEAELTQIVFEPVADAITMAVNPRISASEDEPIPLNITAKSSDPSEMINVTISGVPLGATLVYTPKGGTPISFTAEAAEPPSGDDTIPIVITDFRSDGKLTMTLPANSNPDFKLTVSGVSVDGASELAAPVVREIQVSVAGVADEPVIALNTSQPELIEATLDASGNEISLSHFVTGVSTVDADGSETIALRITGLNGMFNVVGATVVTSGEGEERVWSVVVPRGSATPFDAVKIVTPPNFSGDIVFKVAGVVTENDGDSITGSWEEQGGTWVLKDSLQVTGFVKPSVEAVITDAIVLNENVGGPLDLTIVHRNGDINEQLAEIYIPVGYDDSRYALYLNGALLSGAGTAAIAGDTAFYHVISASDLSLLTVYPKGQLDGAAPDLGIKYKIVDPVTLGSGPDGELIQSANIKINITPASDPIDVLITGDLVLPATGAAAAALVPASGDDIASVRVTQTGSFNLQLLTTAKVHEVTAPDGTTTSQKDDDGSEQLTRIVLQGVPSGVYIEGASQTSPSEWVIVLPNAAVTGDLSIDANGQVSGIEFFVGKLAATQASDVTITVYSQDRGTAQDVQTSQVTFTLDVALADGGTYQPPSIDSWVFDGGPAAEDEAFALNSKVSGTITLNDPSAAHLISVTLSDLPDDTIVEKKLGNGDFVDISKTVISEDGVDRSVWTVSVKVPAGGDGQAALEDLLDAITITTPKDMNDNLAAFTVAGESAEDFLLNAELRVTVIGGPSVAADLSQVLPITPVTDAATVTIDTEAVDERSPAVRATVSVAKGDAGPSVIVDGKLYVQVNASAGNIGGVVKVITAGDGEGEGEVASDPLTVTPVTGVAGVPNGDYYVLDVATVSMPVTLEYSVPNANGLAVGDVTFTAHVKTLETEASNEIPASGSAVANVELANNGVVIDTSDVTGSETADLRVDNGVMVPVVVGASQSIQLTGLSVTLVDPTEKVLTIMLTGVPAGFLVYTGSSMADAGVASQASNAGGASDSNTWIISATGALPAYVGILPPPHWSGTLDGLQLIVASGENALKDKLYETSEPFTLTVTPKNDGLVINPSRSFGKEGTAVTLNLNAGMVDDKAASAGKADASIETTSLIISGLGEYAAFTVGGVPLTQLRDGVTVSYAEDGGAYTITGLLQEDLDVLAVVQAASAITDKWDDAGVQISVTAWTVEGATGETSTPVTVYAELDMQPVRATLGNDAFIWVGTDIDGRAGVDSVAIRAGVDVTTTELADKLSNIETIDLSAAGSNHILGGLTLADVVTITGRNNGTLTIMGDEDDHVELSRGSNWSGGAVNNDGYLVYTSGTVTLLIDEEMAANISYVA